MRRAWWVLFAGCGGSGLERACDDTLAAQTACIDEAWADDAAAHDAQIAALDCGIEGASGAETPCQ